MTRGRVGVSKKSLDSVFINLVQDFASQVLVGENPFWLQIFCAKFFRGAPHLMCGEPKKLQQKNFHINLDFSLLLSKKLSTPTPTPTLSITEKMWNLSLLKFKIHHGNISILRGGGPTTIFWIAYSALMYLPRSWSTGSSNISPHLYYILKSYSHSAYVFNAKQNCSVISI